MAKWLLLVYCSMPVLHPLPPSPPLPPPEKQQRLGIKNVLFKTITCRSGPVKMMGKVRDETQQERCRVGTSVKTKQTTIG